ncbi:hypothetical protein ACLB2K_069387 [Fragaria x ananassa]
MLQLGPFGSENGGEGFDHGAFSTVRQVVISHTSGCIRSIQFEYDDNGSSLWSEKYGSPSHDTYIDTSNKKSYGPYGLGIEGSLGKYGNSFAIESPGNMIVGFTGSASRTTGIRAIGANLKSLDQYYPSKTRLRNKHDDDEEQVGESLSKEAVATDRSHGGNAFCFGFHGGSMISKPETVAEDAANALKWSYDILIGPKSQSPDRRVTVTQIKQKHRKGEPITAVTAYDYPSAVHLDSAGIDIAIVGDSAAMVVHGYDTTLPITLKEMLVHCRAVARGAKRPLLVADLPFGFYESSSIQAIDSAMRILKEGAMDAVKLEAGAPSRIAAAKAIVEAGIAVMGHVGLIPQAISVLGGFRPQGRNVASAVKIPTIGIGAGPFCSGQVLVYHNLLGMMQHPHYAKVTPKFCKQYAHVGDIINRALLEYKEEVNSGAFPGASQSPYKINAADVDGFVSELQSMGLDKAASAAAEVADKNNTSKSN